MKTEEAAATHTEAPAQEGGRGNATAAFAGKSVSINYGRPQLGGRDVLALAQEGMVWRLGKDEATEIKSETDLKFGETVIRAGHYSLWLKKVSATEWQLVFNKKTGMWGEPHPAEDDFATAPATLTTSANSVETFTIEVTGDGESAGEITALWGTSIISAPFAVQTA
ncbi:MAG: DUF2911 domain-containing protein, partial [candidate division KSB1 bacterium]